MCLAAARSAHVIDQVSPITPLCAGDRGCISDIASFSCLPLKVGRRARMAARGTGVRRLQHHKQQRFSLDRSADLNGFAQRKSNLT
jgi:hypothetical protein